MDTFPPSPAPQAPQARDLLSEVEPEVAAFLRDVRDGYRTELPSEVTSGHLRMILAEAAVSPLRPSTRDRWARRARRVAAVGAVKIALTATAAAAATGTGLAAAGALPDAAQTAVANVAEHVGLTFPVPAADTPGDRGDEMPGIGQGGVPSLDTLDGDLPGNSGEAPGREHDADGRPDPATDRGASGDDHRSPATSNAGGEDRGADRADQRPDAGAGAADAPGAERRPDDPAAERPDNPAAEDRPAPPAADGADVDAPGKDAAGTRGPDGDGG